ncbi:hypothetical protein V1264_015992 [Littorina saxatilis]|uniref:C1q domain-containing protein n=1 Tax=Littorina saxatilis TaxID=31220 RepID=A0AAN9BLE5_9CAEN
MAPYTFKATTCQLKLRAGIAVPFTTVVENTLGAEYDPNIGVLIIPRSGTFALSVKFSTLYDCYYGAYYSPVTDCEIMVDGVETPLVLNEKKTCARVVLKLNEGKRVWVEYSAEETHNLNLSTPGPFSVCLLHEP